MAWISVGHAPTVWRPWLHLQRGSFGRSSELWRIQLLRKNCCLPFGEAAWLGYLLDMRPRSGDRGYICSEDLLDVRLNSGEFSYYARTVACRLVRRHGLDICWTCAHGLATVATFAARIFWTFV